MLKKIVLFWLFTIIISPVWSQKSEFGLTGGVSYYNGDLNPKKHLFLIKPAGGATYRYNINPRLAIKGNILHASVKAEDSLAGFNKERNLNFRSNILEFSAQFEFNFFPYVVGNNKYPFTPYIFAGIGMFSFKPQGELLKPLYENGQLVYSKGWYDLQPLGTEGQGSNFYQEKKPYQLTSIVIPFGMGLKFNIYKKTSLGIEYGLRKTYTDYLDDVSTTYADPQVLLSENGPLAKALADKRKVTKNINNTGYQRGNSKNTDWYTYIGITLSYRFKTGNQTCPVYHNLSRPKYQGVY